MKLKHHSMLPGRWVVLATLVAAAAAARGQSTLDCGLCHSDNHTQWASSAHANTQTDVATELAQSHPGETPGSVIQGEDCIACHAPTAVLAKGGMSESQALAYFFTGVGGQFTTNTVATNAALWPHVACIACHNVPATHPTDLPTLALFDSVTGAYRPVGSGSELCGQCHGNLHFSDTDHQIYNGWAASKHGNTQTDVAGELAQSHPGESPDSVIQGEDCIACHAPTAVLAKGGMSESQALGYFFTTSGGQFDSHTVSTNSAVWPGVACNACHDPHNPKQYSFFNSTTKQYQVMTNSAQLCGQCHGNLRFPDTDHLSYNILAGAGGQGITNQLDMAGASCVDCHMFASDTDGSNSKMFGGHTWAVTVPEANGPGTSSCTHCHANLDAAGAQASIDAWRSAFEALDTTAQANVARVAAAMQGAQSQAALATLQQAQYNLSYAESDESGGFHNHKYAMALLNHANTNVLALPVLSAALQATHVVISWTGAGTLQSAPALSGPWADVTGATNPPVIVPTAQAGPHFYRLRP